MMASDWSRDDYHFMAQAIRVARRGLYSTDPNPRVGCVIVSDHGEVFEGWHIRAGDPHAEIYALQAAGSQSRNATCYVSLEPCSHQGRTPPCADALIAAGVRRVVVAMQDPNPRVAGAGIARLREAGVQVDTGLLQSDAESLNPGFIKRMQQGLPYVRCKLAMSLDGRTAMANGESQWITSAQSRRDVQRLRAESSVVMTGINTVLADDCSLTVRELQTERQPIRVVLDSQCRMPATATMLQQPGETWVLSTVHGNLQGAELIKVPAKDGRLDLRAVMQLLAEREINQVLLESGATLAGAMLQAGLVDELILYAAPRLLGDNARGLLQLPGLHKLTETPQLTIQDVRTIGSDIRITARPEMGKCLPE